MATPTGSPEPERLPAATPHSWPELTGPIPAFGANYRAEVAAALPDAVTAAAQRLAAALRRDDPNSDSRESLRTVLGHIVSAAADNPPSARAVADIAVALRDKVVRDVMFGLTGGSHAAAAEKMWARLTRSLPAPDRAEAAALLCFFAYARDDLAVARYAVDVALKADPDHTMARLLETGLVFGMPAAKLARLTQTGRELAADLLGTDWQQLPG
ncbi:DUF4192 domain-containing protein [Nocardia sp. NPDC004722]